MVDRVPYSGWLAKAGDETKWSFHMHKKTDKKLRYFLTNATSVLYFEAPMLYSHFGEPLPFTATEESLKKNHFVLKGSFELSAINDVTYLPETNELLILVSKTRTYRIGTNVDGDDSVSCPLLSHIPFLLALR